MKVWDIQSFLTLLRNTCEFCAWPSWHTAGPLGWWVSLADGQESTSHTFTVFIPVVRSVIFFLQAPNPDSPFQNCSHLSTLTSHQGLCIGLHVLSCPSLLSKPYCMCSHTCHESQHAPSHYSHLQHRGLIHPHPQPSVITLFPALINAHNAPLVALSQGWWCPLPQDIG